MTMTLSGSGTIAGLVAGGLPDATITSADLASNAVDAQTLTLLNATGTAPVYACRAWVNFNGIGTVAIRASGNVSSITDNGTGFYTVNFSTTMPDANYCVSVAMRPTASNAGSDTFPIAYLTSSIEVRHYEDNVNRDSDYVNVAIFR